MSSRSDLDRMRAAMPVLMRGDGTLVDPPIDLVKANHLGPLAFKLGVVACRDEYAASTIVSLRRASLLREVLSSFSKRGVWAGLLKGIGFVGTIYKDHAERPMNDVDLLVPPKQLANAVRCMFELGFERVGMSRKLSGYYHALAFNRGGMMVELHRNIVQPHRTRLHAGAMWDRATLDPRDSGAYRLAPEDELLLCVVHIARHELAVPAINYVDVYRAYGRLDTDQRSSFSARAEVTRVSRAVAAVLGMTRLLADGVPGTPNIGLGSSLLPSTDDVLASTRPHRLRQVSQKLLLIEGPRELAGLGYVFVKTYVDGARRTRD